MRNSTYLGDVVILVYAERHGAEIPSSWTKVASAFSPTADEVSSDAWSKQPVRGITNWPAGVEVPDVRVIPVASLTEVPRALKPVAGSYAKNSPVVPIWLDFDGALKRMFGIIPGEPNVVVLDTQGRCTQSYLESLMNRSFSSSSHLSTTYGLPVADLRVVTRPQKILFDKNDILKRRFLLRRPLKRRLARVSVSRSSLVKLDSPDRLIFSSISSTFN